MQFFTVLSLALASVAFAAPAEVEKRQTTTTICANNFYNDGSSGRGDGGWKVSARKAFRLVWVL